MHPEQGHGQHEAGPEGQAGVDHPKAPALVLAPTASAPADVAQRRGHREADRVHRSVRASASSVSRRLRLGIVQHAVEQPGQRLADARARSAERLEVGARHGQIPSRQRVAALTHAPHLGRPRRLAAFEQRMQTEEIVRRAAHRGEPSAHRGGTAPGRRRRAARHRRRPLDLGVRRAQAGGAPRSHRREARRSAGPDRVPRVGRRRLPPDAALVPPRARAASRCGHPRLRQSVTRAGTVRAVRSPLNHSSRTRSAESPATARAPPRRPPPRSPARSRNRTARRTGARAECAGSPRGTAATRSPTARSRPALEVGASVERVAPLVAEGMVGDGVDGEVPAGQILVQRDAIVHHRMAAVGDDVAAKRGHLVQHAPPVQHADRAVLLADRRVRRNSAVTWAGVADVAKSKSAWGWPSRASRSAPPTHQAS